MKTTHTFFVIAAFAGTGLLSSCKKTCGPWYEGTDCKTEVREKCYGNYTGTHTLILHGDTTVLNDAQAAISPDTQGLQFISDANNHMSLQIKNKEEYGLPDNTSTVWFNVPTQEVTLNGNTYSVYGSGQFEGSILTYTLSVGSQPGDQVWFTGAKPL